MANRELFAVQSQVHAILCAGKLHELSDGQLLERFALARREVGELAFTVLVERHGPMVLRVCRSVLRDPHDAEDAFQAVFLVLVRRGHSLWVTDSLGPWLYQVAHRTALCARSAAQRRLRLSRLVAVHPASPNADGLDSDVGELLHQEIRLLPERWRALIVLCDLEGQSHEQAARHLSLPVGTVKSRLSRARDRLRARLIGRKVEPGAFFLAGSARLSLEHHPIPSRLVEAATSAAILSQTTSHLIIGVPGTLATGVLRSMNITRWVSGMAALFVTAATISGAAAFGGKGQSPADAAPQKAAANLPVVVVKPEKLRLTLTERGQVEPVRREEVLNPITLGTKILKLIPEGTRVKKGQAIGEVKVSDTKRALAAQERITSTANQAFEESKQAIRALMLTLAEGEATRRVELESLENRIHEHELTLEQAEKRIERINVAIATIANRPQSATVPTDPLLTKLDLEDRIDETRLSTVKLKNAIDDARRRQKLSDVASARKNAEIEVRMSEFRRQSDEREARLSLSLKEEAGLKKQIDAANLIAPCDGVIVYANHPNTGRIDIEEGALVRDRQIIAYVEDYEGPIRVKTEVGEPLVDRLRIGLPARVRVHAFNDLELAGRVEKVAPYPAHRADGSPTKIYPTNVLLDQPQHSLRRGMTASVEFQLNEIDNAIGIPIEAIVMRGGQLQVALKSADGRFVWKTVKLGAGDLTQIEVREGLKAGDQVITNPLSLLTEDERKALKEAAPRKRNAGASPAKNQ